MWLKKMDFLEFFYSFFLSPKLQYIMFVSSETLSDARRRNQISHSFIQQHLEHPWFSNPVNCKYGSSSSYGKGGGGELFKDM